MPSQVPTVTRQLAVLPKPDLHRGKPAATDPSSTVPSSTVQERTVLYCAAVRTVLYCALLYSTARYSVAGLTLDSQFCEQACCVCLPVGTVQPTHRTVQCRRRTFWRVRWSMNRAHAFTASRRCTARGSRTACGLRSGKCACDTKRQQQFRKQWRQPPQKFCTAPHCTYSIAQDRTEQYQYSTVQYHTAPCHVQHK